MKVIETERMILRPFVPEDVESVYAYAKNPNVGPAAGWKPHESIKESIEVMNAIFLNQESVWAMVLKSDGRLFGSIGLMPDPKRQNNEAQMLGYSIDEAEWGKGLTTEASLAVLKYGFEEMCLNLISAYCYPDNHRSVRVMEKCGMVYEGVLIRSEKCFDGVVRDSRCYVLTVEKFKKMLL